MKGDSIRYSIRYDDGDFIEDFSPEWGIATERHYNLGIRNEITEDMKVKGGGVYFHQKANVWRVVLPYGKRVRVLGDFSSSKDEGLQFLEAVKEILTSFGKTQEEQRSMREAAADSLIKQAIHQSNTNLDDK